MTASDHPLRPTDNISGDDVHRKILRGTGWTALSIGSTQILALLGMLVLARMLEPSAFALMALAYTALAFVQLAQESGLFAALVYQRRDVETAAATALVSIPIGFVLGATLFLGSPLLGSAFRSAELTDVMRAMSAIVVIGGFGVVPRALIERELAYRSIAKAEVAMGMTQFATSVGLAVAGFGVWSLVLGALAGTSVRSALYWVLVPWRPSPRRASLAMLREMIGYGRFVSATHMLNLLNRTLDNVVVARFLGTTALGYYAISYRLAVLPTTVVGQIMGRAMFPAYSALEHDLAGFRKAWVQNLQRVALTSLPLCVVLAVGAEPIVRALLGEKWLAVVAPLQILVFYSLVKSFSSTAPQLWLGIGKPHIGLVSQIAHLSLMLPALIVFTPRYGLAGAAWSMLAVEFATGTCAVLYTLHLVSQPPTELVRALLRPLLCSGLLAVALVLALPASSALPPPAALALHTGVGIAAYLATVAVFARSVVRPMWSSLRSASTAG